MPIIIIISITVLMSSFQCIQKPILIVNKNLFNVYKINTNIAINLLDDCPVSHVLSNHVLSLITSKFIPIMLT